jgi:hypothetical protein
MLCQLIIFLYQVSAISVLSATRTNENDEEPTLSVTSRNISNALLAADEYFSTVKNQRLGRKYFTMHYYLRDKLLVRSSSSIPINVKRLKTKAIIVSRLSPDKSTANIEISLLKQLKLY